MRTVRLQPSRRSTTTAKHCQYLLFVPLMSISQIFAVNNAYASLLIIIGVAIDSWGIALFVIGGLIVGSVTSYVLCGDWTFKV